MLNKPRSQVCVIASLTLLVACTSAGDTSRNGDKAPAGGAEMGRNQPSPSSKPSLASNVPEHNEIAAQPAESEMMLSGTKHLFSKSFLNVLYEGSTDKEEEAVLSYHVGMADKRRFTLLVPMDIRRSPSANVNFSESGMFLMTEESSTGRIEQWAAYKGSLKLSVVDGRVRAEFLGLELRTSDKTVSLGDISIEGRFARECFKLAAENAPTNANGTPVLQHVADPDWTSDFCRNRK